MDVRLRALTDRLRRVRRRVWVLVGLGVAALASFPFWGGALGARAAASVMAKRLGVPVSIDGGLAGLRTLTLRKLRVGESPRPALAAIDRLEIPYAAAWG